MLRVSLICVGKLKEKHFAAACAEYEKRLGAFCKLTVTELPEQRLPDNPSAALIAAALEKEAELIRQKIPAGACVVSLCVEGGLLSSEALSAQIEQWAVSGVSCLCFIIGGSFGLHPGIKQQSKLRLSMSPMTFPHHLARVMVLEQIYRAFQISGGTQYHK